MEGATGLPVLNVSEASSWPRWIRAFELYIVAKNITDWDRKKALLLHCGGTDLQDIYYSLPNDKVTPPVALSATPNKGEQSEYGHLVYKLCVESLTDHFAPKKNIVYERYIFRNLKQKSEENIEQFLVRLRAQAIKCEFVDTDDQLRDQLIFTCTSTELQKQALRKGTITLGDVIDLGKSIEALALHTHDLNADKSVDETNFVHRVAHVGFTSASKSMRDKKGNENDDKPGLQILSSELSEFNKITKMESAGQEARAKTKCSCKVKPVDQLLMGWELYKPRRNYSNSNARSKSSSTDVLRQMLTGEGSQKKQAGRPTALARLVDMMKKQRPPPPFEYGNCLQQTLNFDESQMKYEFLDKIIYKEPEMEEIYLHTDPVNLSKRKNPFAAVQLRPISMYQQQFQPPGQEYVSRRDLLMDPQTLW